MVILKQYFVARNKLERKGEEGWDGKRGVQTKHYRFYSANFPPIEMFYGPIEEI
jgi:hypothetical protein